MKLENFIRYGGFIFVGVLMTLGTLVKLLGFADFSSDWFWFIAGVGLTIEGTISYYKQKKFDNKYKIIEKKDK